MCAVPYCTHSCRPKSLPITRYEPASAAGCTPRGAASSASVGTGWPGWACAQKNGPKSTGSPATIRVCATMSGTPCRETARWSNRKTGRTPPPAPARSRQADRRHAHRRRVGTHPLRLRPRGPPATWCSSPWWVSRCCTPCRRLAWSCRTARCGDPHLRPGLTDHPRAVAARQVARLQLGVQFEHLLRPHVDRRAARAGSATPGGGTRRGPPDQLLLAPVVAAVAQHRHVPGPDGRHRGGLRVAVGGRRRRRRHARGPGGGGGGVPPGPAIIARRSAGRRRRVRAGAVGPCPAARRRGRRCAARGGEHGGGVVRVAGPAVRAGAAGPALRSGRRGRGCAAGGGEHGGGVVRVGARRWWP